MSDVDTAVSPVSAADREAVTALLGREPAGEFTVVVRHSDGSPLVIRNAALLHDGTPMPTRYWLVGEPERTWVGRLESRGGVDRAEAEVDPQELAAAHERFAAERDASLPPGHAGPRPSGGVGGTRIGVKCLHAHYAWLLAGGDDPVGRWVADRLAEEGLVADARPATPVSPASAPTSERPDSGPVVAAVDCGTNSTRLLVAHRSADGLLRSDERLMRITRLGQGVDATGRLDPEAIERTLAVLRDYRAVMERHGVARVRATATSAARDAANRDDFLGPAAAALGSEPELLAGRDEGRLAFAGATADLPASTGRVLVFDIGGGSTELVVGTVGESGVRRAEGVVSLDVGCVRVTERFLHSVPPSPDELSAATAHLDSVVSDALVELGLRPQRGAPAGVSDVSGPVAVDELVGLAGTVSTVSSVVQGLSSYDRERTHHHRLTAEAVDELTARLSAMTVSERAAVPGVEPGRAEVIVGGCLVLQAVLRASGASGLLVSEADILDGLALSLLDA